MDLVADYRHREPRAEVHHWMETVYQYYTGCVNRVCICIKIFLKRHITFLLEL